MPTPRYKIRPDTGELQEYLFEYNGILALKNFVARVDGERLILHSAADMNFSILDALVSEVEIDGRVYDNAEAAQEALMRLTFNTNRPVLMTQRERELLQGALQRGTYVGTAADLKALIDGKVDKVPGKGLSTNDYTNQEKQTNQTNAQKRVVGVTVTGDVTKILTITLADSSVLQASFTDKDTLPNNLADVKLNSLNFNRDTGVLTGVRSDGQQLTVNLDGRYALLGHTHDDRYSRLGHTHSEYALRTHRHHWDDIDGKPALATEGKIQEAIGKIQVGGRNLLRNSRRLITNNYYGIANYVLTEELKVGDLFTITIKGRLGEGKIAFALYDQLGSIEQCALFDKGSGIYQNTFNYSGYGNSSDKMILTIFVYNNSVIVNSTIEWVKLERGNTPTDWSPAPEDLLVSNNARATGIDLTHAHNNATIFLEGPSYVDMTGLEDLDCVSFRKCFGQGVINFVTRNGKQIVYTGDSRNMQEGGEGSTAVVSVYGNKIYVDIRNV